MAVTIGVARCRVAEALALSVLPLSTLPTPFTSALAH